MILLHLFMYLSAGKCWQLLATAFMNYGRVTQGGGKVERELRSGTLEQTTEGALVRALHVQPIGCRMSDGAGVYR